MKKIKSIIVGGILSAILLMLAGCQESPATDIISSKNDGSFNSNAIISAEDVNPSNDSGNVSFSRNFSSTDESVHFNIAINQTIQTTQMPIVQVSSHFLTEEDAKRVATALFPDATFYEAEPPSDEKLSKNEINAKINRWSKYTNINSLKSIYGDTYTDLALNKFSNAIKIFIENYTKMYETAPENISHVPAEWRMRKTLEYLLSQEELNGVDMSDSNDEVSVQFVVDNIPYYFTAATRNKNDFKVNMISVFISAGMGPVNLDERIFYSDLTRTAEPTQANIDMVKSQAERMLSEMNLGKWEIDECFVESQTYGDATEYTIFVNAVPVLNNVPVLRHTQLSSLKNQDGYAAEQYYTDANFAFSADGKLLSFNLFTPLETQNVVNENVKVMDITSLLEKAQKALSLTDSYAYGFGNRLPLVEENVQCTVSILDLEYGLSRIKAQGEDDAYYYVPSIILKGTAEYVGSESGNVFYTSTEPERILCINAVDGTIINDTNA